MENILKDREIRDYLAGRVEVLDAIKRGLETLPGGEYSTLRHVASYYGVKLLTIRELVIASKYRDEFACDGLRILNADEINEYKAKTPWFKEPIVAKNYLAVLPRRAVVRVGMLLSSRMAREVQQHLLNSEATTTATPPKGATIKDILEILVGVTGWQVEAAKCINKLDQRQNELEERVEELESQETQENNESKNYGPLSNLGDIEPFSVVEHVLFGLPIRKKNHKAC